MIVQTNDVAHQRALRLARVIGQDLALYHADKLAAARSQQDVLAVFADELRDAWQTYRARLPADVDADGHILRSALLAALQPTAANKAARVL